MASFQNTICLVSSILVDRSTTEQGVVARFSHLVVSITKAGQGARLSSTVIIIMSNSLSLFSSQDTREEDKSKSMVMEVIIMKSRTFTDRRGDRETSKLCHQCFIY